MIPEQALLSLPEALTGSKFPEQSYEGGIVGIFNLALLQTLNGRNVPDPISCIQSEKPFRGQDAWPAPEGGKPRYLRGDIYLNIDQIRTGSERLSAYGWRFHNWIEAKFFRKSSTNPQKNTGDLLADLLRILTLVPDQIVKGKTITGRYLLHVHESMNTSKYLTLNKRIGGGTELRKWLAPLVTSGATECPEITLQDYEAAGVLNEINAELGDLTIQFHATTLLLSPIQDLGADFKQYTCVLSRIDSFSVKRGAVSFSVGADRQVTFVPDEATVLTQIREHVGQKISTKVSEEEKPSVDEITSDEAQVGGAAIVDGGVGQ